jgi:hypothetical protein
MEAKDGSASVVSAVVRSRHSENAICVTERRSPGIFSIGLRMLGSAFGGKWTARRHTDGYDGRLPDADHFWHERNIFSPVATASVSWTRSIFGFQE